MSDEVLRLQSPPSPQPGGDFLAGSGVAEGIVEAYAVALCATTFAAITLYIIISILRRRGR